jgi:hypothetical protein
MNEQCKDCKFKTSVQGYFNACNNPERLDAYKRFYYVEVFEQNNCSHKQPGKKK